MKALHPSSFTQKISIISETFKEATANTLTMYGSVSNITTLKITVAEKNVLAQGKYVSRFHILDTTFSCPFTRARLWCITSLMFTHFHWIYHKFNHSSYILREQNEKRKWLQYITAEPFN